VRRKNQDATVDSICDVCYQTIANAREEGDLAEAEHDHRCDPNAALDRLTFARHVTY
jgi:hypothetical protein